MKSFVYTVKNKRPQKMGGVKQDIVVYRMKNNKPRWVGTKEVDTASYKGDESTAFEVAHEADEVSNKDYKSYDGYMHPDLKDKYAFFRV